MMSPSDGHNQKAVWQWDRRLAVVAKENGGPIQHFSADQLLMIPPTVTFWYSLHTSGNANDEPLAKVALWHVTLFCLYRG